MARFSFSGRPPHPIALLTDFGFKDSYVGVMKGVIRGIAPMAQVIDLSHNIMPHDVAEAAFVLLASYRYFPPETIFTCVVDPGVGSGRAIACLRARGQTFLAPDNGLLSVIADQAKTRNVIEVTAREYFLDDPSTTFHGRDIFAPVAAHLAEGLEREKLGPPLRHLRALHLPHPLRAADGSLRGEIIYIDQFGNLITNMRRGTLEQTFAGAGGELCVNVKHRRVRGIVRTYADAPAGDLVALVGSSGFLEVAVSRGSAARVLGCEKGDTVTLSVGEEE